ncbi:hypothetical protein BH09PSE4_BH09PSE4_03560 [soil metagenome]
MQTRTPYAPPSQIPQSGASYTAPTQQQPQIRDSLPPPLPPGVPEPARFDTVGYAGWYESPRIGAAHQTLPLGSFVEVTSLDTGKTVVLPVLEQMGATDKVVGLSRASGQLLGATSMAALPVRVRAVTPSPIDQAALRNGQPAAPRPDTPPVLLNPLRHRLPGLGEASAPAAASTAATVPGATYAEPGRPVRSTRAPTAAARGGYYVQVATLSSRGNADALARQIGGSVSATGNLWRIRLGPYADLETASQARDGAAQRGYADARILRED